jgi:CheY-like chemotaxis protein
VDRENPRLLIAAPDEAVRETIAGLVADTDIETTVVADSSAVLSAFESGDFDCLVMAPGISGTIDVAEKVLQRVTPRRVPVVLYAPEGLSKKDEAAVKRLTTAGPVKEVQSVERLLDQIVLFLHVPTSALPPARREAVEKLYRSGAVLAGKKVLIVDDDIRNIFALTSVLEKQDMAVLSAETGRGAIELLHKTPGIDVVLMDIMMPGMDGYETMRAIRRTAKFRSLPIIAVTAKAMKGDREKTIEAGAWDYLSKPVDTEQMLSVLRAWLCR